MDFVRPQTWTEALAAKAAQPDMVPIAGGTDVMVELNFDRRRPEGLLDVSGIPDLATWEVTDGLLRLGAGVTYTRIIDELGAQVPALAMASRTVGSPQIRNRGTVGGNLGAASPAGDAHPALIAAGASVELQSVRGIRVVPIDDFYTGVKRNCCAPDELIAAVVIPTATGPQQFCKIGTRNAMVISVTGFSLALWPDRKAVGAGIGSVAPTPRRAAQAEQFLNVALDSFDLWSSREPLPQAVIDEFTGLVRADAAPIDDVRGTRSYRLHALSVIAGRALRWAWRDYRATTDTTDERKAS